MVFLFGCANNSQKNNSVNYDSSIVEKNNNKNSNSVNFIKVDTTKNLKNQPKDYNSLISTKLSRWTKYYKTNCSKFNINDFSLCSSEFMEPYEINLGNEEMQELLQLYKPYLIWNYDSTKAIDLYSINVILSVDSLGKKYGEFDVDCHVDLIDIYKQKRIVLQQSGSYSNFDDGFWIDKENFVVTEIGQSYDDENISNNFFINYYVINVNSYQIDTYCSKNNYKLKKTDYLMEVFRGVDFE